MQISPGPALYIIAALLAVILIILIPLLRSLLRQRRLPGLPGGELRPERLAALEADVDRLRRERAELLAENRELTAEISALRTKLEEAEKKSREWNDFFRSTREQMEKDFQVLADRIFTQKSRALSDTHRDGLQGMLQPVREQLMEFRKKVEDVHARDARDRTILVQEIEHLKKLNLRISEDAVNLTSALKGKSKVQGLWGEMVLERLLEDSGLKKGHEYETQVCLRDEKGNTRFPDVLVRLPEDRAVVIDAKVSLRAFEQACRAAGPDDEARCLQQHLDSLKKHIAGLADKRYHQLEPIQSPDFVVLFIPTEGAFQAAVTTEPGILQAAMQKKIIMASPSTLLAILKIVHHMWRQDEQNRNSLAIAKQAGSLYDKFMGFIEAFEEIGTRLHQSHVAWETARNRLSTGRGNLISRAESLKELGIQSNKTLPGTFRNIAETAGDHDTDPQE
jgi:DNA recombination protein RmuC